MLGTSYQLTAFQQFAESGTRLDLSLVGTYLLDAVHEGVDAAVKSFERQGGNQVGPPREALCLEDGKHAVGTHELGAVEQGQSFLALQFDRLPAELVEHTDGLALLSLVVDVAHADEGQEEVGQRSEVARSAQ